MRIGIFVSSQVRDRKRLRENLDLVRDGFRNAELVFGLYDYQYDDFHKVLKSYGEVQKLEEPHIHYEPYIDNPNWSDNYQYTKKLVHPNPRHKHQTKQILCHNELMKTYGKKYDIIVRMRYDCTISPFHDFTKYAEITQETMAASSITTRADYTPALSILNVYKEAAWYRPHLHHDCAGESEVFKHHTAPMMLDSGLLIHRSQDWDCDLVDRLHKDKKLLAAEFGWYQVLIENTEHNRWIHYDGGASISRSVLIKDREIMKKIL